MATRYVWDTYDYEDVFVEKSSSGTSMECQNRNTYVPINAFIGSTGYYWDSAKLRYLPSGATGAMLYSGLSSPWDVYYIDAKRFPYITLTAEAVQGSTVISPGGLNSVPTQRVVLFADTNGVIADKEVYWNFILRYFDGNYREWRIVVTDNTTAGGSTGIVPGKIRWRVVEAQPTTKTGRVSADRNDAYGNGTVSNGRYWKYLGSDNIDPTAISCSTTEPKGGETITATVTPRSNTYGGTIYYQYQYSTNGGSSWTNQGGKTTSTTQAFTIPKGAEQFRVRVVASDNYGFTSTTYVTGANLAVTNMRVYIGVGGKARKVSNLYIGVNGKARKVVKGYIGDANGKARAWF